MNPEKTWAGFPRRTWLIMIILAAVIAAAGILWYLAVLSWLTVMTGGPG